MLRHIGIKAKITSKVKDILNADKLILSGVGAYDSAIERIHSMDLLPVMNERIINEKIPLLGICLGMQLLTNRSEEGRRKGFGWISGDVVKFDFVNKKEKFKIPHMGWNQVNIKKETILFRNIVEEPRFYFVHSYHVMPNNKENILCTTNYGYDFVSALEKENLYGVQFHPEKSHKFGMQVLKNFVELT